MSSQDEPWIRLGGATLRQLAFDFRTHTDHHFEITDPALVGLQVGGRLHAGDIAGFIRILEENYGVQAERHDGQTILRVKK